MGGTVEGGKRAAKTNKKLYGEDFYKRNGSKGGKWKGKKGFALNKERASEAGRKGGLISRRTGVKNGQGKTPPRKRVVKPQPKPQPKKKSFFKRIFGGK